MEPQSGPGRWMGEGYKLLGLGMTFAGGIIVFMLAGLFIDRWLGVLPLFTVTGTLAGAALSFYYVYLKIAAVDAAEKARKRGSEAATNDAADEANKADKRGSDGQK